MGFLNGAFQKYMSNLFISVVRYGNEWQVYSKVKKNGSLIKKFSKVFPCEEDKNILGTKVEEYIDNLYDTYNYVYISYFLDSMGQGAISGVSNADFTKNSVDIKNVNHIKVNDSWSVYSSYIDINFTKNLFKNIGVDFIYSPFILTYDLFKSAHLPEKPVLYLLNHDDFITISVCKEEKLLFGAFFKTSTDDSLVAGEEVENWEEEQEEIGLDATAVTLDDVDEEMSTLEDLEDLDDIDSFASAEDSFSDFEEEEVTLGRFDDKDEDVDLELYGRDILVYKYLQKSINEFYHNPLYESDFLEKVVLYDGFEVSSDMIEMIETELMLDIEIHKINIGEVICDLSIKDAKV